MLGNIPPQDVEAIHAESNDTNESAIKLQIQRQVELIFDIILCQLKKIIIFLFVEHQTQILQTFPGGAMTATIEDVKYLRDKVVLCS